jgi:CSLREA domain-containing protein
MAGGLVLAPQAAAPPVVAATPLAVTTIVDEVSNNAQCSLREAIIAARRNTAVDSCGTGTATVADTIILPARVFQITLADATPPDDPFPPVDEDAGLTGDLDIAGGLVVRGAGASKQDID